MPGSTPNWHGRIASVLPRWLPDAVERVPLGLARWLEARKGLLSLADQGLVSAGNFATAVILARVLGPAEFGRYILASAVMWVVIMLQNELTLQPLVVNGAALSDSDFRRFLRANIPLQVILIVGTSSIVAAGALLWEPLQQIVVPLTLATAMLQVQEFSRRALYTRAHVGSALINNTINYDLQVLLLAGLAWLVGMDIGVALWTIALTSLLAALLGIWQLRRFATDEKVGVWAAARESFRIGRWTAAAAALGAVSNHAFPALVGGLAGITSAAGFGAIRQALGPPNLLLRPLDNYYLARATRALEIDGPYGLTRTLSRGARAIVPLYVACTLVLVAAPSLVLGTMYGEQYLQFADALRLFALARLLYLPSHILHMEIRARRLQQYVLVAEAVRTALIYTGGLYLIAVYGVVGAGVVTLLATAAHLALYAVVIMRARGADRAASSRPRSSADNFIQVFSPGRSRPNFVQQFAPGRRQVR